MAKALPGGLSTSIKSVRANIILSVCVAITGIGAPMGLSFILNELVGATSLQAFAAGAALCSTSLGTTFSILSATNLVSTRLGTVTTSAAMLDDVVGLVMVQIISNLGGTASSFDSLTVIRPVFVSTGFAVGLFLLCAFLFKPMLKMILSKKLKTPHSMRSMHVAFLYHTGLLVGLVAGATFAGTSSLFAAYLAGVIVTWLDGLIAESSSPSREASSGTSRTDQLNSATDENRDSSSRRRGRQPQASSESCMRTQHGKAPTGKEVYEKYYKQPVGCILTPLFFVSQTLPLSISLWFIVQIWLILCIGVHWVCHSYHRDVSGKYCMAWHDLCALDDVWETHHGCLACPFLIPTLCKSRKWIEKTVFPHSFALYDFEIRQTSKK